MFNLSIIKYYLLPKDFNLLLNNFKLLINLFIIEIGGKSENN